MALVKDSLGRPLRDLRISVSDRCNFRCGYCMPSEVFTPNYKFLPKVEILSFEEITRTAKVFAQLGTRKVRLTGGEPLLRRDLSTLIKMLSSIPEVEDLALTTNGQLLQQFAEALFRDGLHRITVSLDSLDGEIFRDINGGKSSPSQVTAGIETALNVGLKVKINMVVQRGINESQILPIAHYGKSLGVCTRFIEFMDVGNHNTWLQEKVFSANEIVQVLSEDFDLTPIKSRIPGEVARRFREKGNGWEIGLISSVTQPFCQDCVRIRLTADGTVYTCLFATTGFDIKEILRTTSDDEDLFASISGLWGKRSDRYSEVRFDKKVGGEKVEMHYVGG